MGSVYRATDTSLDRAVALKIMNPGVATNADFLRRFKSEARVLGRLQHPNIVNVYTFRHVDSHLIIVMEYVGGGTLSDLIDEHGAIPVPKSVDLLQQSLNALNFAHSSNIIHRDIKPPNILLTEEHQVKVSDFGLAKIQEDSNATMVTRVGMTGGTLHYMPPEQTEALSNVDHRGDLYSLGMTFYQMLAGRVPFDRNSSAFSILRAIDQQKIPAPDSFNSNIPKSLVEIVMKSIKKYPDDRYQSATEMMEAINHFQETLGSAPEPEGGFAKTQILSKPPMFGGKSQRQPSQPRFQKSKSNSGHKEKFAVGSRSSSKVKKEKKSSRVSKAGKSMVTPKPASNSKIIPIVGAVLLLLIAGIFLGPRLFSSSSDPDLADTNVDTNVDGTPQNASTSGNQTDGGATEPIEEDQNQIDPGSSEVEEVDNNTDNSTSTPVTNTPTSPPNQDVTPAPTNEARTIQIYSTPSGATVRMNGRERGTTPLTLDNIQPELQRFEVSYQGYETANLQLDVSQRQVLRAELTPLTGQIRIVVRPFGDIFVNGVQKASETIQEYRDELTVGTHTIMARHPALGIWEKQVNIRAGQLEDINFNFAQEFELTVASQPPNAEIFVDNEPLMTERGPVTTPRRIKLRPGNHSITVRLQGFKVTNGPIDVVLEEDLAEPLLFMLATE